MVIYMNISRRRNKYMLFGQLEKGDFFEVECSVYMKIENVQGKDHLINAISVSNNCFVGMGFFFKGETRVEKLYNPTLVTD